MENNDNDNFVTLLADSTFKYMFKDYRDFFKKVIKFFNLQFDLL